MKPLKEQLMELQTSGNLRRLPKVEHQGKWVIKNGVRMLNLSSNDYLGLANRQDWTEEFLAASKDHFYPFSSSSSRLLTGNYNIYDQLEKQIANDFEKESALIFNSGYHANTGILPALADKHTLILADKLAHASMIDGIRLSGAPFLRYKHNDYEHLERMVEKHINEYEQLIIVTESIFSMDGDVADLLRLVYLKKKYPNIILYVDEAHAIGVRGERGLGISEEQGCIQAIDILVGTFGKALASMGAYVVCSQTLRDYLVNTMRPLIFSTALPPFQIAWTYFIWKHLPELAKEREDLHLRSERLAKALRGKGGEVSNSHIVPYIVGASADCVLKAEELQRKGFYCLPVRPPTVPQGTSRIRFSLTAQISDEEMDQLINILEIK